MNNVTETLAKIAHEYKTPIGTISMSTQLLKTMLLHGENNIDDIIERLDAILYYCNRMEFITDAMLNASDTDELYAHSYSTKDIGKYFQTLIKNTRDYAARADVNITLSNNLSSNDFCCDYELLEHIVLNIITNAIKYNDKKSKLINITIDEESDCLVLKFKDNGMGMTKKDAERIFDKFYRIADSKHDGINGAGLGLYITKKMVNALKGEITVDSKVSKGTEFTITLPKNSEPSPFLNEIENDYFSENLFYSYLSSYTDYVTSKEAGIVPKY